MFCSPQERRISVLYAEYCRWTAPGGWRPSTLMEKTRQHMVGFSRAAQILYIKHRCKVTKYKCCCFSVDFSLIFTWVFLFLAIYFTFTRCKKNNFSFLLEYISEPYFCTSEKKAESALLPACYFAFCKYPYFYLLHIYISYNFFQCNINFFYSPSSDNSWEAANLPAETKHAVSHCLPTKHISWGGHSAQHVAHATFSVKTKVLKLAQVNCD